MGQGTKLGVSGRKFSEETPETKEDSKLNGPPWKHTLK